MVCVKIICGDGIRYLPEPCDDGNTLDNDGCNKDCDLLEPGFSCLSKIDIDES